MPRLLLRLELSSQTGHVISDDRYTTVQFSYSLTAQSYLQLGAYRRHGCACQGVGFPCCQGHRYLNTLDLVLCMLRLQAAPCPSLPTKTPQRAKRSSELTWPAAEGFGAEGSPLQPVTCPSYLSLHCQLIYSNRQVGDRAGRRGMTLKCNKRRGTQGNLEACLRPWAHPRVTSHGHLESRLCDVQIT